VLSILPLKCNQELKTKLKEYENWVIISYWTNSIRKLHLTCFDAKDKPSHYLLSILSKHKEHSKTSKH